jgi:hypothetical protein
VPGLILPRLEPVAGLVIFLRDISGFCPKRRIDVKALSIPS